MPLFLFEIPGGYIAAFGVLAEVALIFLMVYGGWLWLRLFGHWLKRAWMFLTTVAVVALPLGVSFLWGFSTCSDAVDWYAFIVQMVGSIILGVRVLGRFSEHDEPGLVEKFVKWLNELPRFPVQPIPIRGAAGFGWDGNGKVSPKPLSQSLQHRVEQLEREMEALRENVDNCTTEIRSTKADVHRLKEHVQKEFKKAAVGGIDVEIFGLALTLIGTFYAGLWALIFD
jgi:uncharacterized protein (UPF0335 family)